MSAEADNAASEHSGETRLQLVFSGECLEGHDPQVVRDAVARALKLDEARAARLFSGRRVVMRRDVDVTVAHRHVVRFAMLGAVLRVELERRRRSSPPPPPPPPAPLEAMACAAVAPAASADAPSDTKGQAWRTPLRWAGIATLSIAGGLVLGVVLGPGLQSQWPEATPPPKQVPAAAATGLPTAALAGSAPAAAVPAETVDEVPADMTARALEEHRERYLKAPGHKAFAISAIGAHAWNAGAATENAAREAALAGCTAALPPDAPACRVVDADGQWLE